MDTPVNIHSGVIEAVSNFQVPETLGFGTVIAPIMYRIDYADGRWGEPQLLPSASSTMAGVSGAPRNAKPVFAAMDMRAV